jgi:glycosyltransferase involved in cell wall biosynthesis
LSHCERLEYPQLEVIVVDDGSTDNTAEIARAHPRARLITLPRSGLSVARNAGYSAARGELVAYIDADAYPSAEWPWYLAFAATGEQVGGAGGPNLPPPGEPPPAQIVARTPGGPLPALRSPDRASHLPGCNMAFRREVLVDLGGFDPDLPSAEDVDFQLRLATRGLELGYHPAAFVWHHRRPGVRTYLRQQYSYGRGQTLLALRNPEYFHRHRLHKLLRALGRRTRPDWPAVLQVSYTSLRWRERAGLDLAHQWGVPLAIAAIGTAPLGLVRRTLVTPAAAAATSLVGLFCVDTALALGDLKRSPSRRRMAAQIAALQLLRPPAFVWGTFTQTVRLKLAQARAHPRSR